MEKKSDSKRIYSGAYSHIEKDESISFGPYFKYAFLSDPFHLTFQLARHRFVSRILEGKDKVLEVGCQEGFTSLLFAKQFNNFVCIDNNQDHISDALKYAAPHACHIDFRCHDVIHDELDEQNYFEAGFAVDVFEHIPQNQENQFIRSIVNSLTESSTFVIGLPSLEHQQYTSEANKEGHVNCKTAEDLKSFCLKYFKEVLIFTMNDEIVHMGFKRTANYLFAVCIFPKK